MKEATGRYRRTYTHPGEPSDRQLLRFIARENSTQVQYDEFLNSSRLQRKRAVSRRTIDVSNFVREI